MIQTAFPRLPGSSRLTDCRRRADRRRRSALLERDARTFEGLFLKEERDRIDANAGRRSRSPSVPAQNALGRSRTASEALADNSPDLVIRYDRSLRVEFANLVAGRRFGLAAQDIIGKTLAEMGRPPEAVAILRRCQTSAWRVDAGRFAAVFSDVTGAQAGRDDLAGTLGAIGPKRQRRSCARRTATRASFWPCFRTSCAIRLRPSPIAFSSSTARSQATNSRVAPRR